MNPLGSGGALAQGSGGAGATIASLPPGGAPVSAASPRAKDVLVDYSEAIRTSLLSKGIVMLPSAGPGHPEGSIAALVLFEKPRERTYRMLSQAERQGEYQSDVSEVVHIERFEGGQVDEHRIKMMFVKIAYRLKFALDPSSRRILWGLDDRFDNGVEHISGSWELWQHGETQTLGRFATLVRVGKGLPSWLEESVSRTRVPVTVESAREWVNSDGRWRP
jgi:hypothetical protein